MKRFKLFVFFILFLFLTLKVQFLGGNKIYFEAKKAEKTS